MISRPTTEQLLLDCCRELMEAVLPALTDETTQIKVVMLDQVLRNAAIRSAHEIAWMREEIPHLTGYAAAVAAVLPSPRLDAALLAFADAPGASLHLDDVVATYVAAGETLSVALETAVEHGHADLVEAGEAVLEARIAREHEVLCGWSPAGR